MAFALSLVFPKEQSPIPMSVLFVIATVVIFLLIKGGKLIREKKKETMANILAGIFSAGVFVSGLYYFAGEDVVSRIPEAIRIVFINEWSLLGWILVPLVVLSLLRGKKDK